MAHQMACARYGVSKSYFATYSGVMRGLIPAERVGNRWFVREADIPKIGENLLTSAAAPKAA